MLMNFLDNQNHKFDTQNWFIKRANLQKSINEKYTNAFQRRNL